MKCPVCKNGETQKGKVVVTLSKGDFITVYRNVPADICQNCGEEFVDSSIAHSLLELSNETLQKGVIVDIRDYRAA